MYIYIIHEFLPQIEDNRCCCVADENISSISDDTFSQCTQKLPLLLAISLHWPVKKSLACDF